MLMYVFFLPLFCFTIVWIFIMYAYNTTYLFQNVYRESLAFQKTALLMQISYHLLRPAWTPRRNVEPVVRQLSDDET